MRTSGRSSILPPNISGLVSGEAARGKRVGVLVVVDYRFLVQLAAAGPRRLFSRHVIDAHSQRSLFLLPLLGR